MSTPRQTKLNNLSEDEIAKLLKELADSFSVRSSDTSFSENMYGWMTWPGLERQVPESRELKCECGQSVVAANKDDNHASFHSSYCPIYKENNNG